jgi:hypothetical protein
MRLSYILPGLMALLLARAAIATADFYTYRDAQGQRHFTNDASTIPVADRQQAAATRRKAAGPLTLSTVQAAMATPAPSPASPAHRPIQADQFERLQLGMSSRDVAQRLGTPAVKITQPRRQMNEPSTSDIPARRISRFELWYYPGSSQGLATRLIFHDGVLRQKSQ